MALNVLGSNKLIHVLNLAPRDVRRCRDGTRFLARAGLGKAPMPAWIQSIGARFRLAEKGNARSYHPRITR